MSENFAWLLNSFLRRPGDKELVQALVLDGEITQIFDSQESRWIDNAHNFKINKAFLSPILTTNIFLQEEQVSELL